MKTLYLSIFVTLIITIGLISLFPVVFAEESITVSTDKTSYQYGENYTISGQVNPVVLDQAISIVILSPNYPHPESLSISPGSDGRYSYTLPLTISDITSANFTLIAKYAGATNQTTFSYTGLPCNQQNIPAHVYAPIIRGPPANNPRVLDSSGNALIGPVKVGQQIQITYDLANGLNCVQPFAYIVQIQDVDGKTVSLSWITGTLLADQSLNPAQSWTPQHNGTYTAQIFTWQSIDNPNALAPPVIITLNVEPNSNLTQPSQVVPRISSNCNEGFTQIIKKEDDSPACVTSNTAQKLMERGWAKIVANPNKMTNTVTLENYFYYGPTHKGPKVELYDHPYDGIDNNNFIVSINNQTYYQTTLNYTTENLTKGASMKFHNVTFIFPEGVMNTPGGSMLMLDVKLPDGSEEIYGQRKINSDGSGVVSGISIPNRYGLSNARNSTTVLGYHEIPQAGLAIYQDKIKLLVSK
jgi:hypothetical protein